MDMYDNKLVFSKPMNRPMQYMFYDLKMVSFLMNIIDSFSYTIKEVIFLILLSII